MAGRQIWQSWPKTQSQTLPYQQTHSQTRYAYIPPPRFILVHSSIDWISNTRSQGCTSGPFKQSRHMQRCLVSSLVHVLYRALQVTAPLARWFWVLNVCLGTSLMSSKVAPGVCLYQNATVWYIRLTGYGLNAWEYRLVLTTDSATEQNRVCKNTVACTCWIPTPDFILHCVLCVLPSKLKPGAYSVLSQAANCSWHYGLQH